MNKYMILFLIVIVTMGCRPDPPDPMNIPLTEENYDAVMDQIRRTVDTETWEAMEDLKLLVAIAQAFSGDDAGSFPDEWEGQTMREVLEEMDEEFAEEEAESD